MQREFLWRRGEERHQQVGFDPDAMAGYLRAGFLPDRHRLVVTELDAWVAQDCERHIVDALKAFFGEELIGRDRARYLR